MKNLLLSALLVLSTVTVSAALQTPSAELQIRDGKLILVNRHPEPIWGDAVLSFSVNQETSEKPIALIGTTLTEKTGAIIVAVTSGELTWETVFTVKNRLFLGTCTITNNGAAQLWLEPVVTATFQKAPEKFWDGGNFARPVGAMPLARCGIKGKMLEHIGSSSQPFPCGAAVFGKQAAFIGHRVFEASSYNSTFCDPSVKTVDFRQRVVAEAGQTLEFTLTTGAADGRYGVPEGVIQQYYDSFPECWAVSQGQENPYVWGNQGHYQTWWSKPDPERVRRLHITLEWAYTPYKRSGEMLALDKYWDYEPHMAVKDVVKFGGVKTKLSSMTAVEFRQLRKERFLKHGKRYGWMFYNTCAGMCCEYTLAKELYPDAINDHDKDSTIIWNGRWSTHHDKEIRMLPYGNSYAEIMKDSMTQLAEELDLPGFAFDCGGGGIYYRGPVCEKPVAGRAWDDEGIYIDQSVSIMHMVDVVHAINPEQPLTCWVNGTLKGDFMLMERSYVDRPAINQMVPLYRWWIGPRPGSVHKHGYIFSRVVPNWRQKNTEQFVNIISQLADYVILNQFKYGLNNTRSVMKGTPQTVYIIPEALELVRAGWQATIPVVLSNGLYSPYSARYGKNENVFLFLGNSSELISAGTVQINTDELTGNHGGAVIMTRKLRNQASQENIISRSFCTLPVNLTARTPMLYETVALLEDTPEFLQATATSLKSLPSQIYTIKVTAGEASTSLKIRKIRDYWLSGLKLDGVEVAFEENAGSYRVKSLELRAGSILQLKYNSTAFSVTDDDICDFRYLDDQRQVAFGVFADGAAVPLVERFNEYFRYCAENKMSNATFTPVSTALAPGKGVITLAVATGQPAKVYLDKGGISLQAPTAAALDKLITAYFYRLDKKFPTEIPFGDIELLSGLDREQIGHFKIAGTIIPYRKYFE